MPIDEFSFDTREEKTCGIAYAKCMQCDSRFEIVIPVTLGPEFTMRRLDQDS